MPDKPVFLYVEDDTLSREIMRMLLVDALGFSQVTIFEDSADFMGRLTALAAKPDVIFLDIHMVPHDGFALLAMLRNHAIYRDAKVIALTASVMSEEVKRLKSAGFNGGISKPINQGIFAELINRIVKGETVWHVN